MKKIIVLSALIALILSAAKLSTAQRHEMEIRPVKLDLTAEQWREDLKYFAEEVPKRHKNAFHSITREQFETAVKQLYDEIPNLKPEEIFVGFQKLIVKISDGHTALEESSLYNFGIYPLRYYLYPDGVYIQSAAPEYAEIVGGKIIKIGNTPIEQALSLIREIVNRDYDNEMAIKSKTALLLTIPKVLQGLKIAGEDRKISLTVEINGRQKLIDIKAVTDVQKFFTQTNFIDAARNSQNQQPLYLRDQRNYYWFEYLKDSKILYVQFNQILNKTDENVEAFFKRVFDFVENNPVDKFVLDLRVSTGGNSELNRPVVIDLIKSKINERGKLFVITGRRTFSASQNLIDEIEKYTNAIFIGEPTASSPNLYADGILITLPNSNLPFQVSTLWHQQAGSRDARQWTAPEIFIELTAEDYRNNCDPVLQAVINYAPGRSFKDLAAEVLTTNDITAFIEKYRAFRANTVNKYANIQSATNALGYQFLRLRKINEAIEIFKLNVELYPNAANVYDSLAEAYLAGGNRPEAIKNYEKALSIDPNFQSSADALRKLKN